MQPIHEELEKEGVVIDAKPITAKVGKMTIAKDKEAKASKKMAPAFPLDTYYIEIEDEIDVSDDPRFPQFEIVKKRILKKEFANVPHRIKCRIRAGLHFGVHIDHLQKAYNELSGKKIDGLIINDLIDRFGFSDGLQCNRGDLSSKYKMSIHAVEVADQKLKNIISHENVMNEYKSYIENFISESKHELKRDYFNV